MADIVNTTLGEPSLQAVGRTAVTDFQVCHCLFQMADELGYINDYIFLARIMFRFGIEEAEARRVYFPWKRRFLEAITDE